MPQLMPKTGPQRALAASNFIYTLGSGLYLTAGVLYFTEAVHLPVGQVGLGLGIAGAAAQPARAPERGCATEKHAAEGESEAEHHLFSGTASRRSH
jgi:hypothetical protein